MTSIEAGQFDDAREAITTTDSQPGSRSEGAYIDNVDLVEANWSESGEDTEGSDVDEEAYGGNRVEDEDWEIAERGTYNAILILWHPIYTIADFTKQYNRLRQHFAVRTGNAQGTTSSINQANTVAALPAVNHPRSSAAPLPATTSKDRTTDQLAALAKYSSRIAKIDVPYFMGVGVNRKGPSATANLKDKSDRATNEQVLDPRTRIILFKMIGRELIHEVNGCVSTGKEVLFVLAEC